MANDVQLAVYMDESLKARLDHLKETQGVSIAQFIRLAIEDRLNMIEQALSAIPNVERQQPPV